jgi:predicted RNA-binding Zn-ribbon protein involved in translation (DUF1610 family)
MNKYVTSLVMIAVVVIFTSCGRHIAQQKTVIQHVTYLCPMHKEYISSEPGKCPKCGMALVSYDDYRNSKTGNQNLNMTHDTHSGTGASGGSHAGCH